MIGVLLECIICFEFLVFGEVYFGDCMVECEVLLEFSVFMYVFLILVILIYMFLDISLFLLVEELLWLDFDISLLLFIILFVKLIDLMLGEVNGDDVIGGVGSMFEVDDIGLCRFWIFLIGECCWGLDMLDMFDCCVLENFFCLDNIVSFIILDFLGFIISLFVLWGCLCLLLLYFKFVFIVFCFDLLVELYRLFWLLL